MDIKERTGRIFMIGLPAREMTDDTRKILETVRPGSVILFSRNIYDREQVARLIEDIRSFLGYRPLMAVDQEGGIVTRLRRGFSQSPGAMALVGEGGKDAAYLSAKILAEEMKSVGFDWNLAPVVDINNNSENPAIGIRSFSSRRDEVIEYAREYLRGLHDGGVLSCLKHFPGNGRVVTDPHLDMPVLEADEGEIRDNELVPFLELTCPCWMPTHLYAPALQTRREPITVSREVLTGWVRERIGYRGLLLADDMNMGGVSLYYPPAELAERALMAGMDMLSFCDNGEKQMLVKNQLELRCAEEEDLRLRVEEAASRVDELFARRDALEREPRRIPDFSANGRIMDGLSRRSVRILKNRDGLFPLKRADNVYTVRSSRLVLIEEGCTGIPPAAEECARLYDCPLSVYEREIERADREGMLSRGRGKVNLIFTENGHLSPSHRELVKELGRISEKMVLVALRNPYDCDLEGVDNGICSYGYNDAQNRGIIGLLTGKEEI